jgi:hypothetical protein
MKFSTSINLIFAFAFTLFSTEKGLVGHWTFDGVDSKTFFDVTGHGYNASATGTGYGLAPGVKGQAVGLAGGNYEIIIANSKDSFNLKNLSIECWFFSNLLPSTYISVGAHIFEHQSVASGVRNGYALHIDPQGIVNLSMSNSDGSGWYQALSKTSIQENRWYHIVGTLDSGSMKVYINGVCETTLPYSGSYIFPGADTRIGCQRLMDGTLRCFINGKIDELKLFNFALPSDSVFAHYSGQKPFKVNLGMKQVYAKPGDSLWIPVYITNYENFNISACQFSLHFDTSLVRMTAVSRDSGIAKGWDLVANFAKIDTVPIAMGGLTKSITYGEGELIRCKFIVNAKAGLGKSTAIDFQNIKIDENNALFPTSVSGKIIIAQPVLLYGDVTGNGDVTALDAARILEFAVGQITIPNAQYPNFTVSVADVSGNGSISSYDAALIFQYCVGMLPSFPVQNLVPLAKRASSGGVQATSVAEVFMSGPVNVSQDIYQYVLHGKNMNGFVAGDFALQCDQNVIMSIKDASPLIKNANFRAQFDAQQQVYKTAITTNDGIENAETDLLTITVQQKPGISSSGMLLKSALVNEGRIPTAIVSGPVSINQTSHGLQNPLDGVSISENSVSIENYNQVPVTIRVFDIMGRIVFSKIIPGCQRFIYLKNPIKTSGIYLFKITLGKDNKTFRASMARR